jgi:hypothetical protein
MALPQRRQILARALPCYRCAAVAIDGPPVAGTAEVCGKAKEAATIFCMPHAICLITLIKLDIWLQHFLAATSFAAG